MARIVVLGAGLGGVVAAFEMRERARRNDEVIVINETEQYNFVPSNPWVMVGWRKRKEISVDLVKPFKKKNIQFIVGRADKVVPEHKHVRMEGGETVDYDYLIIATGPQLAFDEIEGFGPHNGNIQSVCHIDHAEQSYDAFEELCKNPGPVIVGAVQGASCYGPAYETAMILDTELRKRRIRDQVPMTFVTSEPYVGHLGLDGVGDTKGLLESEMRERHIKWITNARVAKVEPGAMHVEVVGPDKSVTEQHELPMAYSMMLPAFKGVDAVLGVESLVNPRGFILIDEYQRNPTYPEIYGIGVCVAIPPMGDTPVPVGVPKTGFMIESMVTAATKNIAQALGGQEPTHKGTWNAICLADFGDGGVVFIAQPQIPPRNVNWSAAGGWVHLAKVGFEKYFLGKIKQGKSESFYEKATLNIIGTHKIKGN